MTSLLALAPWLDYDAVNDLGWTLIHFLWQGVVLMLPLQLVLPACRSARARYNFAFATLLCMAAAPVATFLFIHHHENIVAPLSFGSFQSAATDVSGETPMVAPAAPWMNWLVSAWLFGVVALSVRIAGGWYAAHRLTRHHTLPLPHLLLVRCEALVRRMGISRSVRFLQSTAINVPAVVGWLRPVVLLPVSALTGFPQAQLEAVIMHELAHIRRLDALANLVQIALETALFYHPAVWWISRRIRIERENCCDDIAVGLSGDALGYARALTALEAQRGLPLQAVAASGGVLKQRVARLLGLHVKASNTSALAVAAVALICLASCMVAQGASEKSSDRSPDDVRVASASNDPEMLIPPPVPPAPVPPVHIAPMVPELPEVNVPDVDVSAITDAARRAGEFARSEAARMKDEAREQAREAAELAREEAREAREMARTDARRYADGSFPGEVDQAYVDAMKAAGLDVPSSRLVALKATGVTPEYVKSLRDAGLQMNPDEILVLFTQHVTADYIKDMRAAGITPSTSQLIALRSQGVTADFVRAARANGDVSVHDIIGMRAMRVDPADAGEFKKLGMDNVSMHELASYKAVGATPEYMRSLQAAGLDLHTLSSHDLTAFKTTGVTPELVKAIRTMGVKDLTSRDYITAQVRGLTPEFLAAVRSHNFSNLTMRQLLALKEANVF